MLKILRIILILVALGLVFWVGAITNPAEAEAPEVTVPESLLGDPLKSFAYMQVAQVFGIEEWRAFDIIVMRESGWTEFGPHYPTGYTKDGVKSNARGLGGLLDSTFRSVGYEPTDDPYIQVPAMIKYIQSRYGTPSKALQHHSKAGWY